MCFAQVPLCSCFSHFRLMMVETRAKYFEDGFGSTWGNGMLLPSLSAGCCNHSFLYGKKLFALNSLLEKNGFTFFGSV